MAVQGPFKKYFSLQNWILKIQKWQKVGGGVVVLLLPGMRVQTKTLPFYKHFAKSHSSGSENVDF